MEVNHQHKVPIIQTVWGPNVLSSNFETCKFSGWWNRTSFQGSWCMGKYPEAMAPAMGNLSKVSTRMTSSWLCGGVERCSEFLLLPGKWSNVTSQKIYLISLEKTSSTNCGCTGLPRCAPYLQLLDQLGREIWTKVLEMWEVPDDVVGVHVFNS